MQFTFRPVLNMYLAESMLYDYFKPAFSPANLQELKAFVCENLTQEVAMRKMLLRIIKKESNQTLLSTVIHVLPKDWQMFLLLKYKWRAGLSKQTATLNVSVSQLANWNDAIRLQVINALHYRLTVQDIFFRTKIVNMLEVLATLVEAKEKWDPHYEIIDECWFRSIVQYYDQYSELLERLDRCMRKQNSKMDIAVAAVVSNPNASNLELANQCGINAGSYGRYLRTFRAEVRHLVFD
mgnify:CR=1 FL=1